MKNNKLKAFIHNFSYTLTSNFISLLISLLVVLIIPKLIGVKEYGYWQLYLFYTSFVGFLHFGWNDGIYLKYGGMRYEKLEKPLFFSQFWLMCLTQLLVACAFFIASFFMEADRMFVIQMTGICAFLTNSRYFLLYVLQATNRIKEYASSTILDRVIYCVFILMLIVFQIKDYRLMIAGDLVGRAVSFIYMIWLCKAIVWRSLSDFYLNMKETIENITIGAKLMASNTASKLIIGVVKFGIESIWSVETFGRVSLTLSISNLMMTFINALGLIMFPLLRRTEEKKLPIIYELLRNTLMVSLFGLLIFYYPIKEILIFWLPAYKESLIYMALVFPMCIYEGKMSLLINTYLKAMRMEKQMLQFNVVTLLMSILTTSIAVYWLQNLTLAVISIVFLLAFRCVLAEWMLAKKMAIAVRKDILLEVTLTILFISIGWFFSGWQGVLLYAVCYLCYLFLKRKAIRFTIIEVKRLVFNK